MRVPVFILFMAMTMGLYAQKYKVGTTTALWKVPASTDFSQARSVGVEYVEVAFNQCYRGVPADEVVPRIRDMKAKIDSAGIKSGLYIFLFPERWIYRFSMKRKGKKM